MVKNKDLKQVKTVELTQGDLEVVLSAVKYVRDTMRDKGLHTSDSEVYTELLLAKLTLATWAD